MTEPATKAGQRLLTIPVPMNPTRPALAAWSENELRPAILDIEAEARASVEQRLLASFRYVEHEIDFLSGKKPVVQADKFEAWLKRQIADLSSQEADRG